MQTTPVNTLLRGLGELAGNPLVSSVVTDSRQVQQGSLFVCIPGERTDGHRYAAGAVAQGAHAVLALHAVEGVPPEKLCVVPDVLDAMITVGANYRAQFSPCVIGVTGSVGKTTTKEFCYAVFSAFGKTLKTEGNQNNEIGVPNTLLRLDDTVQYAVVEMGMQGLGEIEKLTLAAKPAGAVITGIGVSHLQQLGTRENICRAKLEICEGMPAGAPLVLNADDDLLPHAALRNDLNAVFFGVQNPQADVRGEEICPQENGTRFVIHDKVHGRIAAYIPALGLHNVMDALSAYALATRLGLDAHRAARALAAYKTTGHRQNIVRHAGVAVIEDCYNASPDSMRAALATLGQYPVQGKRIAMLGDMFELGSATRQAHTELADACVKNGVDMLVTTGESAHWAYARAQELGLYAVHCADKAQAVQALCQAAKPGDAILVKASHGMAFETILSDFYAAFA